MENKVEQGEKLDVSKKRSLEAIRDDMAECESAIAQKKVRLTTLQEELDGHPARIAERLREWGVPEQYWARVTYLSTALVENNEWTTRCAGEHIIQRDDWQCVVTLDDGVTHEYGAHRWTGEGWDSDDLCLGVAEDWDAVMEANGTDRQASQLAGAVACMAYYDMNK